LRSPVANFETQFFFPAEQRFVTSAGKAGSSICTASSTKSLVTISRVAESPVVRH